MVAAVIFLHVQCLFPMKKIKVDYFRKTYDHSDDIFRQNNFPSDWNKGKKRKDFFSFLRTKLRRIRNVQHSSATRWVHTAAFISPLHGCKICI